jgi:DNA-binding NarL/FixJ family response regulator
VTCQLSFETRSSRVDLSRGDIAWGVLGALPDPIIETSFESIYANALALAARYEETLVVANKLLETARRYRLEFATPYGLVAAGMAYTGLRRWDEAERRLDQASERARSEKDRYVELFTATARIRLLLQQGRSGEALAVELPDLEETSPGVRADAVAARALALAVAGRVSEAVAICRELKSGSTTLVAGLLATSALAVAALRLRDDDLLARIRELEEQALERGAVDLLITTYRSVPELLPLVLRTSRRPDRLRSVMRAAGDDDLLRIACGPVTSDRRATLTRREHEVYQLLVQGLSNRQIAEALFISESTAKLHAHHIYEKVGVRSRMALVIQAALERQSHATSATGESEGSAS